MCVLQRITCFSWSVNFCCWNQAWMLQTFLNSTNFSIVPGLRYYCYYTHLMASFPAQHGQAGTEKVNQSGFKWGKRWWFFWIQWHQLDHVQTVCTSLQTDNHTNTSSLNFYRPGALLDAQPTVSKHWRQCQAWGNTIICMVLQWDTEFYLIRTLTINMSAQCCTHVHIDIYVVFTFCKYYL